MYIEYTDFNNLETQVLELAEKVYSTLGIDFLAFPSDTLFPSDYLFPTFLEAIKTDWATTDFPYVEEVDRIKRNIKALHLIVAQSPLYSDLLEGKRFFDCNELRKLENSLVIIEKAVDEAILRFSGESYAGETIWL